MWQDLAALTPPLIVCVTFIIGLIVFLRWQMGSKRDSTRGNRRRPRNRQS
jgi:hypothetical protein